MLIKDSEKCSGSVRNVDSEIYFISMTHTGRINSRMLYKSSGGNMSRKIKYKFWHSIAKRFWNPKEILIKFDKNNNMEIWKSEENGSDNFIKVNYIIPIQFLFEKDGIDYYESDIAKFEKNLEESQYFEGTAYINSDNYAHSWIVIKCLNEFGKDSLDSSSFWNDDFIKIGNIYENPELKEIE